MKCIRKLQALQVNNDVKFVNNLDVLYAQTA
jgi:hypothetical protein